MNLSCQVKLFSPDTHGRESIIFSVLNIRSKQSQRVRQQANGALLHALAACKRPVSGRNGTESGKERSEEHTSELQSLMRISYAVFCLKKKHEKKSRNRI